MTDPLTQLGQELRKLQVMSGLNVNELIARCAPIGRTTISRAVNARRGREVPTPATIVAICRAAGARPAHLLELGRQAREDAITPPSGPQAPDRSRQFTRELETGTRQAAVVGDSELSGLFDPLRRENLFRAVQWALEAAPPIPLTRDPGGSPDGFYALYYLGSHRLYRPVSSSACTTPLYVGSGRPHGYRKGADHATAEPTGAITSRLRAHRKSIEQAEDLEVADFRVRYLPVDETWIGGAERLMVGDHRPVWNTVVEGFGAHNPGSIRAPHVRRSAWDELHKGRNWAQPMQPAARSADELRHAVRVHFQRSAGR
ncbi:MULTISPECIES: Eco29kI family restriction endonuclease [unclassified Streptomyces]|uniref:Eco29kI family restriction endonuclease n=1 Tax=unclassified Streptomyces TaxID=2593676 RepID=UPI00339685CE